MATFDAQNGFKRVIHSIQNSPFRTKFEDELAGFCGNAGIGIISDTDAQPLLFNSHLGRFAVSTVGKINNAEELVEHLLQENMHLSEFSSGRINPTELVGLLIVKGKDGQQVPEMTDEVVAGITNRYVELYEHIVGEKLILDHADEDLSARIEKNVAAYLG